MRKNSRLPNLHNFGIHLRIILIVNLFAVMAAILLSQYFSQFLAKFTELSTVVQPILIVSLLCLYGLHPLLDKLEYHMSVVAIVSLEMVLTNLTFSVLSPFFAPDFVPDMTRACLLAGIVTAIVLYYFNLQQRAYSPAIAEARLQALQARIRPHFLFNSINAVLSLIRSQPKRAESALEDMADLFRVLMADNRDLVPLADEIALCRQYLSLEKLRLEDRLRVNWQIEQVPPDAMIPPLIMQPLLENAVYHGIEPLPDGGEITITITRKHEDILITISNPFSADKDRHHGNKMALKNIKERLLLHFDLEASLKSEVKNNHYLVHIRVPHR